MWRVSRRTRNYEDYTTYKEALNATTNEIGQYKRSYEQKLACNKNYKKMIARAFMYISGLNNPYETRLDHQTLHEIKYHNVC